MSGLHPAAVFLQAVANLLARAALYHARHPAREEAFAGVERALAALRETNEPAVFTFLDGEVIHGSRPLREMKNWPWSARFAAAGVGRLEIGPRADSVQLRAFLRDLVRRLGVEEFPDHAAPPEGTGPGAYPEIRFGPVTVQGRANGNGRAAGPPLELSEEAEAVRWIHESVASADEVPMAEVAAVVRGLTVAFHGSRRLVAPLLQIKQADQYTSAHCINVSILSMALAEHLQFSELEVRAIGEAALLHDIGKTKIPLEVLNKPGALSDPEREIIERHPVEGARLLLGSPGGRPGADLLAAVVAYEHHMHWAGDGGYPVRRFARKPHRFSRLVQVCDVYDALRTRRPFRAPLSSEAALEFLRRRAGSEFDPDFVRAFADMMGRWEPETLERDGAAAGEAGETIDVERLIELPPGRFDADKEAELWVG